jgi:hypothetical protein
LVSLVAAVRVKLREFSPHGALNCSGVPPSPILIRNWENFSVEACVI